LSWTEPPGKEIHYSAYIIGAYTRQLGGGSLFSALLKAADRLEKMIENGTVPYIGMNYCQNYLVKIIETKIRGERSVQELPENSHPEHHQTQRIFLYQYRRSQYWDGLLHPDPHIHHDRAQFRQVPR
jgi:hypothetical protein